MRSSGLGRLGDVIAEFVARNARQTLAAALLEAIPDGAVGQLHDDDQLAVDDVEAFQRQDIRVMDRLDAVEAFEFLLGRPLSPAARQVAVDELDGLEQAARGFGAPDLAEAADAEGSRRRVAGDGFGRYVRRGRP